MKPTATYTMLLMLFAIVAILCPSCSDEPGALRNDFLRKDDGPVLVGNTMEFAYAIGSTDGSPIKAVEITASIPGDPGTCIAQYSRYTNPDNGNEETVRIATRTATEGAVSKAYIIDTVAATIRYFYTVPEVARGRKVKFSFRSITGSSQAVANTLEYTVSNVDIFRNLSLTADGACCFSLETMQAYTPEQVEEEGIGHLIDFIYTYKPTMGSGWTFGHALVAPSNDHGYLYPVELPAGAGNHTLMEKRYWRDGQLRTGGTPTIYVDEIDLRCATLDGVTTHAYELGSDQGVLMRSHDNRYSAYLFINSVSSNTRTIEFSIKRLAL